MLLLTYKRTRRVISRPCGLPSRRLVTRALCIALLVGVGQVSVRQPAGRSFRSAARESGLAAPRDAGVAFAGHCHWHIKTMWLHSLGYDQLLSKLFFLFFEGRGGYARCNTWVKWRNWAKQTRLFTSTLWASSTRKSISYGTLLNGVLPVISCLLITQVMGIIKSIHIWLLKMTIQREFGHCQWEFSHN